MSSTDLELLSAWAGGDSIAGNTLLERYFDPLHRFFVNKVDDEVEDLVQQTLMACVRHQDKLAKAQSFRAYLFRIARNELYDHLSKRHKRKVDFTVSSVLDLGTTPSVRVDARLRQERIRLAMQTLPVDLQVALELHYWQDLSGSELAEALDLPLGTVKSRIRKAKQELERAMARQAPRV